MSWTTQGTVSVENNKKKVYGAGTPWVSNGKTRAGDEFIAPSGARHEVESVQSNTELTLVTPYMGATASGQSYALLHIGLLPAELAVAVSEMTAKNVLAMSQLFDWETSTAATVPLTNPATQVTSQVKPIAGLIADIGTKAPLLNPVFTGNVGIGSTSPVVGGLRFLDITNHDASAGAGSIIRLISANAAGTGDATADFVKYKTGLLYIGNNETGTGAATALGVGGSEKLRIGLNGDVTVVSAALLGYGPGAGGTATQATSKSTVVTLNKPSGKITMHNAALAAGAIVNFSIANSLCTSNSVVVPTISDGVGGYAANYNLWCVAAGGYIFCTLKNISGSILSDAVVFNFNIFAGATA